VETKILISAINRGEEGTIATGNSVTAIMLCYVLELSHNAFRRWRKVIASKVITLGIKK
jgi:hypothetical protein